MATVPEISLETKSKSCPFGLFDFGMKTNPSGPKSPTVDKVPEPGVTEKLRVLM